MKWYKSIIGLVLFCTSWEGNAQMFSIQDKKTQKMAMQCSLNVYSKFCSIAKLFYFALYC